MRLWDLSPSSDVEPVIFRHRSVVPGETPSISSVAFSNDGKVLATGNRGRYWKEYPVDLWGVGRPKNDPKILPGFGAGVDAVLFDAHGDTLAAAGSGKGEVRLWHLKAGDVSRLLPKAGGTSLAFSADGGTLAAGGNKLVRVWDLRQPDADPILLQGNTDRVDSVAISPKADSRLLASGGHDATVRIWDLPQSEAGQNILHDPSKILLDHQGKIFSVAFSPNGQQLASAGEDQVVRLWDVAHPSAKPILLGGHADQVRAVAFSPVDPLLVSASDDKTIRLWDTRHPNAEPIMLSGHQGGVKSVAFSRDGKFLASGGEDGTARIWIAQTALLAEKVCDKVGRNLTLEEWQRFVGKDLSYEKTCENLPAALTVVESRSATLSAEQLSPVIARYPPDEAAFGHYPRTVPLRWSAVPGASSYTVEVQFCENMACQRPSYWETKPGLKTKSYTLNFVGDQPGRWRVWAVDASGREGPRGGWHSFSFSAESSHKQ